MWDSWDDVDVGILSFGFWALSFEAPPPLALAQWGWGWDWDRHQNTEIVLFLHPHKKQVRSEVLQFITPIHSACLDNKSVGSRVHM
jgi:hypothetical protein